AGLGYLAEAVQTFGWEKSGELVFNLGSRLVGRGRGEPERFRRDAVSLFTSIVPEIESSNPSANSVVDYDEDALIVALLSANVQKSFEAVGGALKAGVKLDRLIPRSCSSRRIEWQEPR